MSLTEGLLGALWGEVGVPVPTSFQRMTYAEAMERYGSDRPDLRYEIELFDATDVFRETEFTIARSAIAQGGRVRGIRIPGGAGAGTLSRKQLDEIEAAAKFLHDGSATKLALAEGDLALLVAGPNHISSPALDRVRQDVGRRLALVREDARVFLWVTDFPLFERDPATGRLGAVHHPFTAPHLADIAKLESAPETVRAQAYDVVLNGTELGGGSIRISDPALQSRIFSLLGIDEATANARFGFLLEGLRSGAPPHGGIAFGFDRIAMQLAGATSLRDVIAFPKTTAARALFEGAPSRVPPDDLEELHIRVEERAT